MARALVAPVQRARHRSAWAIGDQVLSSVSNLLLGTVVARNVGTDQYGAFAVGFAILAISLGLSRGLAAEALLARGRNSDRRHWEAESADAIGFVVAFGLGCAVVTAVIGLCGGPTLRPVLLSVAATTVLVLVQDAYRFVLIGGGLPQLAALSDASIIVFLVLGLVLLGPGTDSAAVVVAVWGVSSGLAAAVGALAVGKGPTLSSPLAWFARTRHLGVRFATEFVLLNGASQLVMFGLAATAGLTAAAALRGANVVLGPAAIVTAGLVAAAVPEGRRLLERSDRRFPGLIVVLSVGLCLLTVGWGLVAYVMPASVGTFLLGDTWDASRSLMPVLGIAAGATAASSGLVAGMRALQAASASLRATIPIAVLATLGGILGGYLDGAFGAIVGLAIPFWFGFVLYGRAFHSSVRDHRW